MKSKYSDEKHKFTVFRGHRIIASAWQAPRGAIPAKSLFCFYDALVNHYQACFVIIRHKFIIISYWFLLLGTCHFVISPSLLGICSSLLSTSSLLSGTTLAIRHPFTIRPWLNFLRQASFTTPFPKYLGEEHCVES